MPDTQGISQMSSGMGNPFFFIQPISRLFLARKQKKMADAINPVRSMYQTSPFAQENKSLAQNALNSRAAGAAAMEQGIAGSQAATIGQANRNATSSADALAIAAGSQGMANQGYANLATLDEQHRQQGLGQLMGANRDLVAEGDKVYNDKLLRYNEESDARNALLGAHLQNKYGAIGDIGNMLGQQMENTRQSAMKVFGMGGF